jgi:chromosome partitioning protein
MKTLAVVSQKGGVGKTTLATALAVEAGRAGQRAVVVDLDPQASASFWRDTRAAEEPAITAVPAARLSHVLAAAAEAGVDLAVVDTPPFSKDIAYEAAERADFVLIPTRPAVLDVMAMSRTLELVRHYGRAHAVVLTFCPPSGREVEDTVAVIAELGATLAPVRIGNRVAFSRAQQSGRAAQEIEEGGKAAREIKDLYTYVCMNFAAAAAAEPGAAARKGKR